MQGCRYLIYLMLGVAVAGIPGPGIFYVISESAQKGVKQAWPAVAGALSVSVFFGAISVLGLTTLLGSLPNVLWIIKILGSMLLIYMGGKRILLVREHLKEMRLNTAACTKHPDRSSFFTAFMTSMSNPKTIVYYLLVIPQFITDTLHMTRQYLLLVSNQIMFKATALLLYCLLAGRLATAFSLDRHINKINIGFGCLFIMAGLIGLAV